MFKSASAFPIAGSLIGVPDLPAIDRSGRRRQWLGVGIGMDPPGGGGNPPSPGTLPGADPDNQIRRALGDLDDSDLAALKLNCDAVLGNPDELQRQRRRGLHGGVGHVRALSASQKAKRGPRGPVRYSRMTAGP